MLTVGAYAEQIAAADTGRWRAATRQAAAWLSPHVPIIDLNRQVPLAQLKLQTLALLIYALAGAHRDDPTHMPASTVLGWIAGHPMPTPPEPDGPITGDKLREMMNRWRHELDGAVDRCCQDLAGLLAASGHQVPHPGWRRLDRYSPDPVITVWLVLVDTDAPSTPQADSLLDGFRPPLLVLGLAGLTDLVG